MLLPTADSNMPDHIDLDAAVFDQLSNGDAKQLLDTIDGLRRIQVGEIVNLPQIIVVGDQSSGKSSVLEAISRVRFPVKGEVCTRFATELVLRRVAAPSICVSIQYSPETKSREKASQADFRWTSFDRDALPDIIEEAKRHMGLPEGKFSKDVLRVEISGPDVYPLTLVDLPGFFHTGTESQSPDMKIVDQLVASYMRQKNCIILAVVSAANQLASQKVLNEVAKHDPTKARTLGVITKPDLSQSHSEDLERTFIRLAQNEEAAHHLALGWHVLRNSNDKELKDENHDRNATERRFFTTGNWSKLSSRNRGIDSLRKKLSSVLLEHIQTNLPSLISEIEENLARREAELSRLGKERSDTSAIRAYLADIANEFQRLSRDAIHGRYNDSFFGSLYEDDRKLRARLRNLNRAFDITMSTKGASREILWEQSEFDNTDDVSEVSSKMTPLPGTFPESEKADDDFPAYLRDLLELYNGFPYPMPVPEAVLKHELEKLASDNQGREFPGLPNPDLVIGLFKMHSEPWEEIATFHLHRVVDYSKAFVEQLLSHIVGPDQTTFASVLRAFVDPFFDKKELVLVEKLREIIRPYLDGYALPLEVEFQDRLSKRAIYRIVDKISALMEESPIIEGGSASGVSPSMNKDTRTQLLRSLVEAETSGSNRFGADKVIDMTMAYYEMSRRTFTENVITLAIESCLLCDLPDILAPRMVYRMDDSQLKEVAAESEDVQSDRRMLEGEIEALKEGLYKCRRCRPRERTVLPSRSNAASPAPGRVASTGTSTPIRNDGLLQPVPQPPRPASASAPMRPGNPGGFAVPTFDFGGGSYPSAGSNKRGPEGE